jgi:glucokinase
VSTGIGGGVVADGRLLRGHQGMAGHVGHLRLVADGPICSCGAVGHFEALAAGTALGARARAAAKAHPRSLLGQLAHEGTVGARHVVEGARRGDPLCLELLREEAAYLGAGFTALLHLYSPERLIMGGGVSQGFDLLVDGIRAAIERDALEPFRNVPVVPAALGENSGLVGVAALVMEAVSPSPR